MTFITLGFKNNVITDGTFITLGFKMLLRMGLLLRLGPNVYYRWDLYYTWVQLLHLCLQHIQHICTRLRIDGIKAMSRGFSAGSKQVIKSANAQNRGRVCKF